MTYSIKAIDAISMRRVNKEKYYTGAITKKKKKDFTYYGTISILTTSHMN